MRAVTSGAHHQVEWNRHDSNKLYMRLKIKVQYISKTLSHCDLKVKMQYISKTLLHCVTEQLLPLANLKNKKATNKTPKTKQKYSEQIKTYQEKAGVGGGVDEQEGWGGGEYSKVHKNLHIFGKTTVLCLDSLVT